MRGTCTHYATKVNNGWVRVDVAVLRKVDGERRVCCPVALKDICGVDRGVVAYADAAQVMQVIQRVKALPEGSALIEYGVGTVDG